MKNYLYPGQTLAPFDPWKLPDISDEAVLEANEKFNVLDETPTTGTKRRAAPSRSRSPAKRARA
jgi:hypothetical protein